MKLTVRRYITQGDLDRLIASGMHLEPGNPYHVGNCEWALLSQDDDTLQAYAGEYTKARNAGISVIPGFRIGSAVNAQDFYTTENWADHTAHLTEAQQYTDATKRMVFDTENYAGGPELMWQDMTPAQRLDLQDAAAGFTSLIQSYGIVPLVHPGIYKHALAVLLFDAASGQGVVQSEATSLHNVNDVLHGDVDSALAAYAREAQQWQADYPDIGFQPWTNETVLRQVAHPYTDQILGPDRQLWVFDEYRSFDTNAHLGSREHYEYTAVPSFHDGLRASYTYRNSRIFSDLTGQQGPWTQKNNYGWGWTANRVAVRQGTYGPYGAYAPDLEASHFFYELPALVLKTAPMTAVLSFAVDNRRYGSDGLNVWQRGGRLMGSWLPWTDHPTQDTWRLDLVHSQLQLTVITSTGPQFLSLLIPPTMLDPDWYDVATCLVSIGSTLTLKLGNDVVSAPVNGTLAPSVSDSSYVGMPHDTEMLYLHIWDTEHQNTPTEAYPFHSI